MSITTRAELIAATKRWAQNDELSDEAHEDFLEMTEAHVNARLRVQDMTARVITTTASGQSIYNLPSDARGIRNIEIEAQGKRYPLEPYSPEALDDHFGWYSQQNTPCAYALTGLDLEIQPVPSGNFPMRIIYYQQVPALTVSAPTNWLLTKYPNIYLYGGLHFMMEYLRDEEGMQYWGTKFSGAVDEATAADAEDRWSGATPMMRAG